MIISSATLLIIFSLIFMISLLIVYLSKKRLDNIENRIYKNLLIFNIVGLILNFLCDFVSKYYDSINEIFSIVVLRLFLVYFIVWINMLLMYLVKISIKDEKRHIEKVIYISMLLEFLFVTTLPMDLYRDISNGIYYTYGSAINFVHIFSGIIITIMLVLVCYNWRNVTRKKLIPVLVFSLFGSLCAVMQYFYPELIIITAAESVICFIMYHTIENPDVKMIEQLELAKDAADKANAAKTDFLSSMSHEIRTPLNAIVGFSDCIKNSEDLSEAKENADDIIIASNTLLEIVNGILDISKIEAGKLEIINSNYNASNLFSGLAKLMTPKMNEKGLDFQVMIAPDLPPVLYGDSANVKKVITNLLSNAYKYTDSGFVKYDVKCVNANGVCRLIITVADSGRGIKKESIDKLFTKFQRVDEDRNTTIEGTGLGLAITKQLVELMGGNIVVDSTFGEGSKFTITLDQRIENAPVVEEKVSVDTIDLTGKKILVVDDNSINLKVAKKLLERYNATVEVCDSGFRCIELIDSGASFDLILMDDMMPKMSGTQTLHKLKEKETFKIPVFALTANAITGMKERYLDAGFNSYLSKPIEKETMINEFNKLFNGAEVDEKAVSNDVDSEVVTEEIKSEEAVVEEKIDDCLKNIDYLKSNNIDVDHGLELLGDMELYNDTMNDFIDEVLKRLPLLEEYKNNSDMPNYAILVHAIKSDCKYLGIMPLADINYEHELKSKANDVDFVINNYDSLIVEINKYLEICKKYMGRD